VQGTARSARPPLAITLARDGRGVRVGLDHRSQGRAAAIQGLDATPVLPGERPGGEPPGGHPGLQLPEGKFLDGEGLGTVRVPGGRRVTGGGWRGGGPAHAERGRRHGLNEGSAVHAGRLWAAHGATPRMAARSCERATTTSADAIHDGRLMRRESASKHGARILEAASSLRSGQVLPLSLRRSSPAVASRILVFVCPGSGRRVRCGGFRL